MNVPAIRKALERLKREHAIRHERDTSIAYMDALIRVGLRACDDLESHPETCAEVGTCEGFRKAAAQCEVIADILREAGVEVGE